MDRDFTTGNKTVDRMSRINITGNIIPAAWYKTIRKPTGKPYLNAIVILSDIVYWYRAAEVRDEGSGQLIGFRKRFHSDLLQRSYQQLADQFGISKRDASNAVIELEKLGVIKRVFRTLTINGQQVPNVLFLELEVDVLLTLTYPVEEIWTEAETDMAQEGYPTQISDTPEVCTTSHRKKLDISPIFEGGITQISGRVPPKEGQRPSGTGDTNTENTTEDYNTDYPILSYQREEEMLKQRIEYEILKQDYPDDERLDEFVRITVEVMASSAASIRVNKTDMPALIVKKQFRRLNMFHFQYILDSMAQNATKAHNIRAVMITTLYNAVNTLGNYYGNLARYHEMGSGRGEMTGTGVG
ncbi:MAG: DUF6017 domain-containing protein [Hungatella sp.]|nr:DUF6017 domain-containing protein [Hungatella sp.]